jgi:hypothetical protein
LSFLDLYSKDTDAMNGVRISNTIIENSPAF